MAIEISTETDEFKTQRNLLLVASLAALLILAPDFKGLELNLAIIHLKVDNALYIRGFIFLSLIYLSVRYSQAAKRDDRYNALKEDIAKNIKSTLHGFGIDLHIFKSSGQTYSIKSGSKYLIFWRRYDEREKGAGRLGFYSLIRKDTANRYPNFNFIEYIKVLPVVVYTVLLTLVLSPFNVRNVLDFIFPYMLVTMAILEMSGIFIFRALVYWAGSLFPS